MEFPRTTIEVDDVMHTFEGDDAMHMFEGDDVMHTLEGDNAMHTLEVDVITHTFEVVDVIHAFSQLTSNASSAERAGSVSDFILCLAAFSALVCRKKSWWSEYLFYKKQHKNRQSHNWSTRRNGFSQTHFSLPAFTRMDCERCYQQTKTYFKHFVLGQPSAVAHEWACYDFYDGISEICLTTAEEARRRNTESSLNETHQTS